MKKRHFIAACFFTSLWAALATASGQMDIPTVVLDLSEVLRTGSWLYFLLTLWRRLDDNRSAVIHRILVSRAFIPIIFVILAASLPYYFIGSLSQGPLITIKSLINIVLPVVGLLLIENLLRISGSTGRWGIKHLCLGLGTVMTLDFFIYSDALVQGSISEAYVTARSLITILVAPLILISFNRLKNWNQQSEVKLITSPKAALYTMALVASGCYLLTMAGAAYYIRIVGRQWGDPLQITFMAAALLVMFASLSSSQIKSHAKMFILKNFFSYRYDYREEWLRFIQMMSSQQPLALGSRLVRAVADLMDSPASALWVLQHQDECFFVNAIWNFSAPQPSLRADTALIQYFRKTSRIIEIDECRKNPELYDNLSLPDWLLDRPSAWLIVPLVHRGDILGFVILNQARAPHRLDWEDRDLLNITATQAASYLAEELTAEALRSAQRLEDFNRQFAFVVHDIKNIVGQMSLMLGNAQKFGDNPDFQKDMIETVGNSVNRMRAMLEQLSVHRRQQPNPQLLDVTAILTQVAKQWRKTTSNLALDLPPTPTYALLTEATLISALDLLIDNALTAVGPSGEVVLRLRTDGERIVIEVSDNGPGMDEAYVSTELFRLMSSSKSSGYGIGAYQTRHLLLTMGARLEVDSAPNRGTTMRIIISRQVQTPTAIPNNSDHTKTKLKTRTG